LPEDRNGQLSQVREHTLVLFRRWLFTGFPAVRQLDLKELSKKR
jgi:hypothetical protein